MPYKYNAITGELDIVGEEYTDNPILQIDTDSGSALPDADGILNMLGGTGINTAGAGDTVTINLDGTVATSYPTDSGTATPALNILNVLGGSGVDTSGAGDTITIDLDGTVGRTITGNTGGALPPTAGNWNILTDNSTPIFAGSGSTLTLDFGLSNLNMGSSMSSLGAGVRNVGLGLNNLVSTIDGYDNVAIGVSAAANIENGYHNIAIGNNALLAITDSIENVAVGTSALQGMTVSDGFNTCVGHSSLGSLASGIYNTALGYRAGGNLASSNSSNICIGNRAVNGDSNRIRIGNQGSGDDQQDECFIAGIVGVTNSNAQVVTVDSTTGQLGVGTSSSIISWVDVTGTSDSLEAGVGYVANNAGLVTLTLPASSTLGDTFKVITKGAGLCTIAQNASQTIRFAGSTTTSGVGGSLTATAIGDTLEIVSTADDEFYVVSSIGSWTVV